MMVLFFSVGLALWGWLAVVFLLHFRKPADQGGRHLLDVVSAAACLWASTGPARELGLLKNLWATPIYFVGPFAATAGLCAALVWIAQRRGGR